MRPLRCVSGGVRTAAARTALLFLALCFLSGCDYGRMKDDEALRTFKTAMPEMPKRTIPTTGGIEVLRQSTPDDLRNPLPDSVEVADLGKERYGFYCIQCHGPKTDGYGTVGQSFAPLPANLAAPDIQALTDGDLFYRISLGFNRHPPMWFTASEEERWAIIRYMRRLVPPPKG